ncbi:MAG: membrane protein insertase YidC [Candidatus Latescibacteria bacterium]|nr:membrane protein insertase YidC [Candidatus Latescibacterota bacterium]
MTDTKRMLFAFLAIMVILFIWQVLTPKRSAPQTTAPPSQTAQTTTPAPAEPPRLAQTQPTEQQLQEPETEIFMENDLMKVTFSSYGGTVKSVYLKKYRAQLIPASSTILQTSLVADTLTRLNWQVAYQDDSTLVFANNLRKTYRLNSDYTLSMRVESDQPLIAHLQVDYQAGLALTEENVKEELKHQAVFYRNYIKTDKKTAAKVKPTTLDTVKWVGLKSKYFTSILAINQTHGTVHLSPTDDARIGYRLIMPFETSADFTVYFGPLHYDILRSYKMDWEAVVDLGWTRIFSVAILKFLMFLYAIFKNYGIAIIIFSIIMKAIFFPLSRLSTRQMQQMQMLQPKIAELKKKYKNDPQALNQETMQLYRLYKINPLSGCLPLIFQLPIFWALYAVLQKTIELRQANFGLWINDLSLKDPYYILPILMGVSFLVQNFLTSADKRNLALLIFMPIFLTVIFLNFPSGLQLYWLFFNLLSIGESIISRGGLKWKTQKTLMTTDKK